MPAVASLASSDIPKIHFPSRFPRFILEEVYKAHSLLSDLICGDDFQEMILWAEHVSFGVPFIAGMPTQFSFLA